MGAAARLERGDADQWARAGRGLAGTLLLTSAAAAAEATLSSEVEARFSAPASPAARQSQPRAVAPQSAMSQRVRRGGSPPPAGPLGGSAVAVAGGPGGRLQPLRATVPFQLKPQQQQQHGSPTRGGGNNGGGGASGPGGGAPRSAARTSPTVATQTGAAATATRGTSPTRGARGSPPRPQPPPPSPGASPTHLWAGEGSAAAPLARVRAPRRPPEQRSPSAPVCKAGSYPARVSEGGRRRGAAGPAGPALP